LLHIRRISYPARRDNSAVPSGDQQRDYYRLASAEFGGGRRTVGRDIESRTKLTYA
jgi:hypothetical protein